MCYYNFDRIRIIMIVNGKEINVNELVNVNDDCMIKKRKSDIYLSENQLQVLNKYGINYNDYSCLNSLIFEIEKMLNNEPDLFDLELVSQALAEQNYYNNTNK